jgi:hypothetical protein
MIDDKNSEPGLVSEIPWTKLYRKKRIAAYQLCLKDTHTNSITRKSSEITREVVTRTLSAAFSEELRQLHFTHLEIELRAAGGTRGALFHKLAFRRAGSAQLPKVLSEGEARCLAIAAFFSELSTAGDTSAILFDDPVSSLDHEWRENVASRLAKEAATRQVIVFTHDIVFLLALESKAKASGVHCHHQCLRREQAGAGVSSPELPWVAIGVKKRIGALKQLWQEADKLYRKGDTSEYEKCAEYAYGRLREAWERGLEEVLLARIVERYRPSVQTQHVMLLSKIGEEDCRDLETGMAKCSRWLPGHDLAPAENLRIPQPEELKHDIESLEQWVKRVQKKLSGG